MHNRMVFGAQKDHNFYLRERLSFFLIFFTFVKIVHIVSYIILECYILEISPRYTTYTLQYFSQPISLTIFDRHSKPLILLGTYNVITSTARK